MNRTVRSFIVTVALVLAVGTLASAQAAGEPYLELRAGSLAGRCTFMTGGFDAARTQWQESAGLAHRIGDRGAEARLLGNVAFTFQAQDRAADAIEILHRALDTATRLGDRNHVAWCHSAIGNKVPIELIERSVAHGPP